MSRTVPFLLLSVGFVACERPVTDLTPPATGPSYSFVNGPAELPHVLRGGGRIISAFFDFEQDMLVLAGAPENPQTDRLCGGTELRTFVPVQLVGDFDDVVKQLALLDAITIHVYSPIPPTAVAALCQAQPIAQGTGRYVRSDNDLFGVFGRANAVVEHVLGTVTLAAGGDARLAARFYALGNPDGVLMRFETTVQLVPLPRPQ